METKIMVPEGFQYFQGFLSEQEEQELIRFGERLQFQPFVMRGVPSRRGIMRYGYDYGSAGGASETPPPIPERLFPVRARAAKMAGVSANDFESALFTRYEPGSPIGWHKDLPMFGPVVLGISLLSACIFKLRPSDNPRRVLSLTLEPGSLYVLGGNARREWQHSIPPVKQLRYSITFRSHKTSTT